MISIDIKKNNNKIEEITIKGHANYSDKGKDIVCAAVSAIATYSINLMEKFGYIITNQVEDGYVKMINDANSDLVDKIFEQMDYEFNGLYKQYPKYIYLKH